MSMTTFIAGQDATRAAENNDAPAASITAGMLGVGIVPFVDRRRARIERERGPQSDPGQDYDHVVELVRTEMAEPSR
jgi:hypothetical protein